MSASRHLSDTDVQALLHDPSPDVRATTAAKTARSFCASTLSPAERTLALEIIRLMMRDAEVQVRQALTDNLASNPDVPRDVARALAADVASVAIPILETSRMLTDDDLLEVLRGGIAAKQAAIARRQNISERVAREIAAEAAPEAVAALLANESAILTDAVFGIALDRFPADEAVHHAMAFRARLPAVVAERLVSLVSAALREHLLAHHALPDDMATDLLLQARERAMVEMTWGASHDELMALVERLYSNNRLTPTIILRALCTGDEDFFECAMARLANIPVENSHRLIHDWGGSGLQKIVEHCRLPHDFLAMARIALEVSRDLEHDGTATDRWRVARMVIERVATSLDAAANTENLDYLIDKLAGPGT